MKSESGGVGQGKVLQELPQNVVGPRPQRTDKSAALGCSWVLANIPVAWLVVGSLKQIVLAQEKWIWWSWSKGSPWAKASKRGVPWRELTVTLGKLVHRSVAITFLVSHWGEKPL